MAKKQTTTQTLLDAVVKGMQEKKAKSVMVMDLQNLNSAVADFFVICHGTSDRQVNAIADSVEEQVNKKCKENPWHREGAQTAEWVLLDYINVVVHIFIEEKREFFGLEQLWGDAEIIEFEDEN